MHNVLKEEEIENTGRKKLDYKPSGYMTVEEYEAQSSYVDKSELKSEIPKQVKDYEMKYVPQPTYKIVRYNDPPGSPELNITKKFFQLRQYNGQGLVSPDFSKLVYPVVYYYPNSASTASDIFVIPLDETGTPVNKILKANAQKRLPNPIISTEKSSDNDSAFRSLTPIDFSVDGTKLLVKEKIGSSQDGIWQTNAIVYDFGTKTSYNLVELRDAIIYYWKENRGLNLDDKRWDIIPVGFLKNEEYRVAAYAYGYTGKKPVFLGIWSIDSHGEQARLISFKISDVEIGVNGFKIVQDGVITPTVIEREEKAQMERDKLDAKEAKEKEKNDLKQMDNELKAKLKEMDAKFKEEQKDYAKLQRIKGSTEFNEAPIKFKEMKIDELQKFIKKEEKSIEKEQKALEKLKK